MSKVGAGIQRRRRRGSPHEACASLRGSRGCERLCRDAYGQVREFLAANPCTGLHRALLEVRDRKGDVVLVAASWVEMVDAVRPDV